MRGALGLREQAGEHAHDAEDNVSGLRHVAIAGAEHDLPRTADLHGQLHREAIGGLDHCRGRQAVPG